MFVVWLLTTSLISAAPVSAPKDAGADTSDADFRKAFGAPRSTRGPARPDRQTTVYVPPPLSTPAEPMLERLQPKDVKAVVMAAGLEIATCGEGHRTRRGKKAQLVLRWNIGPNGKVSKVQVVSEELKGSYLASCMTQVVKRLVFPKHTVAGDPVVFPFKF